MSSVFKCPICGHTDEEHLPTWDGRLKCLPCSEDEDADDCFVEVTRDEYTRRLDEHLHGQIQALRDSITENLDKHEGDVV